LTPTDSVDPLLRLTGVKIGFGANPTIAVHDVSLSVHRGEIVGLVGESGSGKSLTCRAALRLLPAGGRLLAGTVEFEGRQVGDMSRTELRSVRSRRMSMILQDPFTSLNPTLRVGRQLVETLQVNAGVDRADARERAIRLLTQVEIPRPVERLRAYPHELSGGMRQRVMIALALAADPSLLIADEPTTALDVSTQAQILDLLLRIRDDRAMSMLVVSHDFGVIAAMCDRVVVMYGGYVVESGTVERVYTAPIHPYTRALVAAVPDLERPARGVRRPTIPGPPLGSVPFPGGCPFAPRCTHAREDCLGVDMHLAEVAVGHFSACPFSGNDASVSAVV
jgi:oligopeptide/dipeptide ABC transporter ATP-binding protein